MPSISKLSSRAENYFGDSLRVVASYDEADVEFGHLRDDVAERYTDGEVSDIREFLLLEGIEEHHVESVFKRNLHCRLFVFEEAITVHLKIDDTSGHFLSIDSAGLGSLVGFLNEAPVHLTPGGEPAESKS